MGCVLKKKDKYTVNILALGDVGGTLLLGLKLLGKDVLSKIGIYDVRPAFRERYEQEINQISMPFAYDELPDVNVLDEDELFNCDLFAFCASAYVPDVGSSHKDVRMAQLEANEKLIKAYACAAREKGFKGIFAVVSDPVDLLCQCAYYESNKNNKGNRDDLGLKKDQIRGYGLGVMHTRAMYFAKKDLRFKSYLTQGRAFGPHGKDLIIANSIQNYDEEISIELSHLAAKANIKIREQGFKPYIAPAISSGAISILCTLRGEWHYSAVYSNGIFFGCKNKLTQDGTVTENVILPDKLLRRIDYVYQNLYDEGARWRI